VICAPVIGAPVVSCDAGSTAAEATEYA
jgi:hypothetical protein